MNSNPAPDEPRRKGAKQKDVPAPLSLDDCAPLEPEATKPAARQPSWDNLDVDDPAAPTRRKRANHDEECTFPYLVSVAGWTWIVVGCLWMLNTAIATIFIMLIIPSGGALSGAVKMGVCMGGMLVLGCAAFLIYAGIRCALGTAKDTIWIGIISLILGFIWTLRGVSLLTSRASQPDWLYYLSASLTTVGGVCVLGASAVALLYRADYLYWRAVDVEPDRRAEDDELED